MRLDAADRSRLVFASLMTGVALPAIWWANEDDTNATRPNVAAAGLPAEPAAAAAATSSLVVLADPAFLNSAATVVAAPPTVRVQVGAVEHTLLADALGSYRRDVAAGGCELFGVDARGTVTVHNPANGQSVDCRVVGVGSADGAGPTVVLSAAGFAALADFTDAPVAVEIRE